MARRRFFVTEVLDGAAALEGDGARHLTRVLRVEVGQSYEISDGARAYLAEISAVRKDFVEFRVVEELAGAPEGVQVTLLMALIKFDHFELLIEKATELGVAEIVPVVTARTELGLEKAIPKRMERWQRIATEASQQSRRVKLPRLSPAAGLNQVLSRSGLRYWLDEQCGGVPLLSAIPVAAGTDDEVALLVGPEGGWTSGEREAALAAGWTRVSLGPRILRAETAAMASLAVVMAAWQREIGDGGLVPFGPGSREAQSRETMGTDAKNRN